MALYKNKFIEIDPETCSIEELEAALDKLQNLSGYYETKQLAIKTFLNSIYGATACKFFNAYNVAVAESTTLQGQDLNHYSENSINDYFSGVFQSQEEYTKIIYVPLFDFAEKFPLTDKLKIVTKGDSGWEQVSIPEEFMSEYNAKVEEYSDQAKTSVKKIFVQTFFGPYLGVKYDDIKNITIDAGRVTKQKPLTGKAFDYLTNKDRVSLVIAGDTDSTISSTKIYLDNKVLTIEDAFNLCKQENPNSFIADNNQEIVKVRSHQTLTYDNGNVCDRNIRYIMRHKVSKAKFKIISESGKELIVTGDHSIMVMRNNELISVPAKDINIDTDKIIEINNNEK